MFEFHGDRKRYFEIQVENTNKYVIPFIEQYKPLQPGYRVMEIGCGEAGVLKAFIDRGCTGVGVELDESRLVNAREWMREEMAANKIFFLSKDIYKVNVEEELKGKFDIIILKDVIEHIHDQPKLISWMKSFLNEGGVIFFGFPPWQMPFGGHQQILRSRFLSKLPYYHLLPFGLYELMLKMAKENVPEMTEIKETRISIERFEKIVGQTGYKVVNKTHYLINPIYEYKFGWKPKVQNKLVSKIRYIRNYFTTCVYYLITGA
ncbi:class I SAM-dependent methyltransferase [Ferruginibacter sp.]